MLHNKLRELAPGLLLCATVAVGAIMLEWLERVALGWVWLESLVLAILIGATARTLWSPGAIWRRGITFSGKTLLEVAVMLLGTGLSAQTLLAVGPGLLSGIAAVVLLALIASFVIGRLLHLSGRMAALVACGNSICGNSAIAAVAPVIGARGEEISASIAFTAVLGVIVVLGLPLVATFVPFDELQYGVLAGLTVYAVPQVLAATAPIGPVAVQIGTLVKLVRVLMLGPVVLLLALLARRWGVGLNASNQGPDVDDRRKFDLLSVRKMVPWYIVGFLMLAGLRSADLVPHAIVAATAVTTNYLTVISMAALGLETDLRTVARAGARVAASVALSLLLLGAVSFSLIRLLGIS
jgi:uncharacterized integral membrane protein (TIGR00698 family)